MSGVVFDWDDERTRKMVRRIIIVAAVLVAVGWVLMALANTGCL